MGLRLNKIPEHLMVKNLPWLISVTESVNARLSRVGPNDLKERIFCHENLAFDYYQLGCMLYQQERALPEVKAHLRIASEHQLTQFQLLPPPNETELRQFPFFDQLLNLLICFGTNEMRQKGASIPKEIYDFRPADYESPSLSGVIEYLELLKKVVAGMAWDEGAYLSARARCLDDKATKLERLFTIPKLESMRAAVHGDGETWNENIAEIVKQHKHEATRGEWREDANAFICLPGLAMAQLGIERGLVCSVNSPYLPLQLLRADA